jgi:hypothetical protein
LRSHPLQEPRENFAEIEIERQHDPLLSEAFL